jgi:hypothetical protein
VSGRPRLLIGWMEMLFRKVNAVGENCEVRKGENAAYLGTRYVSMHQNRFGSVCMYLPAMFPFDITTALAVPIFAKALVLKLRQIIARSSQIRAYGKKPIFPSAALLVCRTTFQWPTSPHTLRIPSKQLLWQSRRLSDQVSVFWVGPVMLACIMTG